jgi:hypothetical protein
MKKQSRHEKKSKTTYERVSDGPLRNPPTSDALFTKDHKSIGHCVVHNPALNPQILLG